MYYCKEHDVFFCCFLVLHFFTAFQIFFISETISSVLLYFFLEINDLLAENKVKLFVQRHSTVVFKCMLKHLFSGAYRYQWNNS